MRRWVVVLVLLAGCSGDAGLPDEDDELAFATCQLAAEDRLVSPGSAEWPSLSEGTTRVDREGGRVVVRSYVDSQNRAGGTLRARVRCVMRPDGDEYEVVSVSVR